jgi:hypothetical protein
VRFGVPAAIAIICAGSGWSAPALANDWGCEVVLCLSNPGGPTQYAACVPPIAKLWRELATGHAFPVCTGGNVARAETEGKRGTDDYRVTMTYTDGSRQTYSLAGIATASDPSTFPPGGVDRQ